MKIIIEDYNGNDMCELHINAKYTKEDTFNDICEIENLINCDIVDEEDEDGKEYLRVIQLNK